MARLFLFSALRDNPLLFAAFLGFVFVLVLLRYTPLGSKIGNRRPTQRTYRNQDDRTELGAYQLGKEQEADGRRNSAGPVSAEDRTPRA